MVVVSSATRNSRLTRVTYQQLCEIEVCQLELFFGYVRKVVLVLL